MIKVFSKINKTPYFSELQIVSLYSPWNLHICLKMNVFCWWHVPFWGSEVSLLWAKELAFVRFSPELASLRKQGFLQDWFPLSQAGYKTPCSWVCRLTGHLFSTPFQSWGWSVLWLATVVVAGCCFPSPLALTRSRWANADFVGGLVGLSEVSFATFNGKGTFRFIYNFYILHMYPWTSKTKQRIVFGMIHMKDSLLPRRKV